jgi:predicted phage-related endonuclease
VTDQPEPVLAVVPADQGSRLEQLIAERAQLAPAVKAGKERLDEVNAAIKGELTRARPDADEIIAAAPGWPALRLYPKTSTRLDTTRLKTDRPDVYEAFAKQSTTWTLEVKR